MKLEKIMAIFGAFKSADGSDTPPWYFPKNDANNYKDRLLVALYRLHTLGKETGGGIGWLDGDNKEKGLVVEMSLERGADAGKVTETCYCVLSQKTSNNGRPLSKYAVVCGKKESRPGITNAEPMPFNTKGASFAPILIMAAMLAYELFTNKTMVPYAKKIYPIFSMNTEEKNYLPDGEKADICDALQNLYTELISVEKSKYVIFDEQGNLSNLTLAVIKSGKYYPEKTITGNFKLMKPKGLGMKAIKPLEAKTATNSGTINNTAAGPSEYTEEEKQLIPIMPNWYIDTAESSFICRMYQQDTIHRTRSVMLRGPSSTGKTTMAKAIASKLGLPYVFITCNQDTDSYAMIGQPMYDRDGKVSYVDSPLVKGIKRGYCIEIQEPLVVAKQGIFTALNSIMDDTESICLPTGEVIKKDPRTMIVMTTNVDYVGCRKINQSVLRRMDLVLDVVQPSIDEMVERVMTITGEKDRNILVRMINFQNSIQLYLQKEEITDGVCGTSELIAWVNAYHLTNDLLSSATYTFVSKCSDDPEVRKYIATQVESQFYSS